MNSSALKLQKRSLLRRNCSHTQIKAHRDTLSSMPSCTRRLSSFTAECGVKNNGAHRTTDQQNFHGNTAKFMEEKDQEHSFNMPLSNDDTIPLAECTIKMVDDVDFIRILKMADIFEKRKGANNNQNKINKKDDR
jgi:hypothetical protein